MWIIYCGFFYPSLTSSHPNLLFLQLWHCTALRNTSKHCTVLYCTVLHKTALYCAAQNCTALLYTELHCMELHCTALHCTVLVRLSASVERFGVSRMRNFLLCIPPLVIIPIRLTANLRAILVAVKQHVTAGFSKAAKYPTAINMCVQIAHLQWAV